MSSGAPTERPGVIRAAIVATIAALSLLPIGNWLGISFQRALSFHAVDWWSGSLLVALLAAVLLLVVRQDARARVVNRPVAIAVAAWDAHPIWSTIVVSVIAAALYGAVAWAVFDARPLLIDEVVQVIQARAFAAGNLWLPLDPHPEFRSVMHMVEQEGRWYAQFPPGGPAMLALGELIRAPWIVNPICGGISVAAFASALRWSGARPGVSLGATLAFGFAPFVVFQSASYMNHVTSLTWLLVATAALIRATHSPRERPLAGLMCGVALGIAASIRPLDAAAWALPAAAWLAVQAWSRARWTTFVLSGVGVAIPMGIMMIINASTTGSPTTFGYTVLWGNEHGLGFHASPWGESHTMLRGLALVAAYLNRLNEYLYEVPVPALLAPLLALLLSRGASALERYLLASASLVVASYFAYWHDGFYLGPRFMYPLAPVAALLVSRLPSLIGARFGTIGARAVASAYAAAIALGITLVLPLRVASYRSGFQSMRWDYDAIVRKHGARGGTVLVRTSWGAQVIARLWGLGVSRSMTEVLYRHVDTCGLDDIAAQLEAGGIRGAAAEARLRPLLADSARVIESSLSSDPTERVLPGSVYPPKCIDRINEDRGGYTHYEPALLTRDTSTRWLRELHARDTLVVSLSDTNPLWLMRRIPGGDTLPPVLIRLSKDSLRAAWGLGGAIK